jgi:hypothetical protein
LYYPRFSRDGAFPNTLVLMIFLTSAPYLLRLGGGKPGELKRRWLLKAWRGVYLDLSAADGSRTCALQEPETKQKKVRIILTRIRKRKLYQNSYHAIFTIGPLGSPCGDCACGAITWYSPFRLSQVSEFGSMRLIFLSREYPRTGPLHRAQLYSTLPRRDVS